MKQIITTNSSTESTLDPPDGEIQEILVLFYFCNLYQMKENSKIKLNKNKKLFLFNFYESKNKLFQNLKLTFPILF